MELRHWLILLFYVYYQFKSINSIRSKDACESKLCRCTRYAMFCDHVNTSYIPKPPNSTRFIIFQNGYLPSVSSETFRYIIHLKKNLQELTLTNNSIQVISQNTFRLFTHLHRLKLANNNLSLSSVYNLMSDLKHVGGLHRLNLNNCGLDNPPSDIFNQLSSSYTLLREQDLQLLKQLIHIHETIRKLSKTRDVTPRRPMSCSSRGLNLSNGYMNSRRPPLVRQQSEPYFCADTGYYRGVSTSSIDEYYDFPDDGLSSESEFDESTSSIKSLKHIERLRTRSVSLIATVPLHCDELSANTCYSDILEKNIKLWKLSQSLDKDSVFDDDTFIIAESDEDR